MTPESLQLTRRLWELIEGYHSAYLSPAGKEEYDKAGLRGGWMRYFAARSSPLGEATVEVIVATFFGFHPRLVARAIPDAWQYSTPEKVIAARVAAADKGTRSGFPLVIEAKGLERLAKLAREAAEACAPQGRALFAAHSALDWLDEPHLELWWAATLLREHRGDGHVALLLADAIDPCESLVWHAATGEIPADYLQSVRGWTDEEWQQATASLRERGWLADDGSLTPRGHEARRDLETSTNRLAYQPWEDIGDGKLRELVGALESLLG